MAQMQALLKIKADVEGEGKVNALGRAIGGLSGTAGKVSGGLKGLAGAAGGLSGALGSLVPLATGAGLAAMAKGAIDAADNMFDLSQKTGVSVESLSKFQQAANASGNSIEGVGAAMIKLNKGLAAGGGPAADALKALGLSATDASGKLKSTDKVMLEIADKFKSLPDGAQKTALALKLFGKNGADMIPLLNGGAKSIEGLSATMSTTFAQGADKLNDKLAALQGKLLQLGVSIGTALMPLLNGIADAVTAAANAFSALPGPIQAIVGGVVALAAAFVVLAPAISAAVSIAGALAGLGLGATIAGWLGAIGPAIAGIIAAFTGLLAWLTGTLIPGLLAIFSGPVGWTVLAVAAVVAMVVLFREPILKFLTWLGGVFQTALSGLINLFQQIYVQPWINLWNNVLRSPVTAMWEWLKGVVGFGLKAAYAVAYQVWVQPWITIWNTLLRGPVTAMWAWLKGVVGFGLKAAYEVAYQVWVQPWINLWNNVLRGPVTAGIKWIQNAWTGIAKFFTANVTTPIANAWKAMVEFLPKTMNTIGDKVKSIFTGVVNTIKGALRNALQFIANAVNTVGKNVNRLIGAFNRLPGPDIPYVPALSVPAFAKGGVVSGPTLAMVGEAGPEYIVPERKAAAFAMNYLNGARGAAAIPAYASGGYVGGNAQINVTTGPVMQQGGQQYVSMADLEKAMRKTADGVYASLRTPAGRIALGRL